MRIIAVDIDGVLCDGFNNPYVQNIEIVNKLHNVRDNFVVIYTARGEQIRGETERQLKEWGVRYHMLVMGKLKADYYVDDRMIGLPALLRECEGEE